MWTVQARTNFTEIAFLPVKSGRPRWDDMLLNCDALRTAGTTCSSSIRRSDRDRTWA